MTTTDNHMERPGCAGWSFLLLFPGFFLYQTAIGIGVLPAVLGGYFSPMCILLLPFLLGAYISRAWKNVFFVNGPDLLFGGFLLYFFFIVALNYAIGGPLEVVKHHVVALLHFVVVFLTFRLAVVDGWMLQRLAQLCLVVMSVIIFSMSQDGAFYLKQFGDSADVDSVATYQGFARSYLVTFLLVASCIQRPRWRLMLYLLCIPAFFMNSARTEFAVALAAAAVIEGMHSRHRVLWLVVCAGAASLLSLLFGQIVDLFPGNRIGELLDISQASSWEARNWLLQHAMNTIAEHPVLGDYGSYMRLLNNSGSYAHNILSAWVDLGLFGFLYLLAIIGLPTVIMFTLAWQRPDHRHGQAMFAFLMLVVTLVMLIFSKSFTYMVIAGAVGAFAQYRSRHVAAQSGPSYFRTSPIRHTDLRQAMP